MDSNEAETADLTIKKTCCLRQHQEIEMLQACFPMEIQLDYGHKLALVDAIESGNLKSYAKMLEGWHGIKLSIRVSEKPEVQLIAVLPSRYPEDEDAVPHVSLSAPALPSELRSHVEAAIDNTLGSFVGEEIVLNVAMVAQEKLGDPLCEPAVVSLQKSTEVSDQNAKPAIEDDKRFGRRLIYSHHIINPKKRDVMSKWALELNLGGYGKIGWPGIIIVEGSEISCQEYVRRIKPLRWQFIQVRGSQVQDIPEGETVDSLRVLHKGFQELGEGDMSVLAAKCKDAGLHDLFMTCMRGS